MKNSIKLIKYPKYKHEAYKKLNKLFLDKLQELQKLGARDVTGFHLEFEIIHYVSENKYDIRVRCDYGSVCAIPYSENETPTLYLFNEHGIVHRCMENEFCAKVFVQAEKLLKTCLRENVWRIKFYISDNYISYTSISGYYSIIESCKSKIEKRGS